MRILLVRIQFIYLEKLFGAIHQQPKVLHTKSSIISTYPNKQTLKYSVQQQKQCLMTHVMSLSSTESVSGESCWLGKLNAIVIVQLVQQLVRN